MRKYDVMNRKTRDIFALYFKDYILYLLVLTVILPVAFLVAVLVMGWNPMYLLFFGILALVYILSMGVLKFYFKVKRDIFDGRYLIKRISIDSVSVNVKHTMHHKSGNVRGTEKLILITEDNERFYITSDCEDTPAAELEMLIAISEDMEITYLPSANFVVSLECSKEHYDYTDFYRNLSAFRCLGHYRNVLSVSSDTPMKKSDFCALGIMKWMIEQKKQENEAKKIREERKKEEKRISELTPEELSALTDDELYSAVVTRTMYKAEDGEHSEDYLSKPMNVFKTVCVYEGEINNGGISQFFFNSSRYDAPFVAKALEMIGALEHKGYFEKFISVNGIELYDYDYCDSDEFFSFDNDSCEFRPDDFDSGFYEMESLQEKLVEYIRKNITEF